MIKGKGNKIALTSGLLAPAVVAVDAWVSWPHLRLWYLFESLGLNVGRYEEACTGRPGSARTGISSPFIRSVLTRAIR